MMNFKILLVIVIIFVSCKEVEEKASELDPVVSETIINTAEGEKQEDLKVNNTSIEKNAFVLDSLCELSIEVLHENFLRKKVSDIKNIVGDCYKLKDSVIYSEENESISWNSVTLLDDSGNELSLLESNWENKQEISRITIYDEKIYYRGKQVINTKTEKIKDRVLEKSLFDSPDGLVALRDVENEEISYLIFTEKEIKSIQDIINMNIDEVVILAR